MIGGSGSVCMGRFGAPPALWRSVRQGGPSYGFMRLRCASFIIALTALPSVRLLYASQAHSRVLVMTYSFLLVGRSKNLYIGELIYNGMYL